jgi:hypothetical protein
MLYLETSLYFEGGPPAGLRERYLSQTDALDAWALYEHGQRTTPAPKPQQRLDRHSRQLLGFLVDERPPGWVAAGCTLLDLSPDSRKSVHREIRAARRRAKDRGLMQRGVFEFADGPDALLVAFVVAPDEASGQLRGQLSAWVTERLDSSSVERVLGLGLTTPSSRAFDALVVVEPAVWELRQDPQVS